ncbi:helix-turn-helix domain-containing protein [Metabacillus fastidiosus]|uniref:helix-turn-helix domain-containing protein n=1 Tax=Metabacillus fastidiosus TaxID=1458 RepID=UPI002DBB4A79|nr:helix-turn-helix transcriptional regulator [Metabacillus fastidiosus]MEC2074485.1 helix-turn-helix transcriptional regulator [Metabacillus fastidiosus]
MVWGFRKPRSKFGRWLDRQGMEQEEFSKSSKVSRNTVSKLCNDKNYIPSPKVMKKIMDTVRKFDKSKTMNDFFEI